MRFGSAGLYFYYSPDLPGAGTPVAPDDNSFGGNAVSCGASTYGSVAVNTALFGAQAPSIYICAFSAVGAGTYGWQPVLSNSP